jgi:hypothetical protein
MLLERAGLRVPTELHLGFRQVAFLVGRHATGGRGDAQRAGDGLVPEGTVVPRQKLEEAAAIDQLPSTSFNVPSFTSSSRDELA